MTHAFKNQVFTITHADDGVFFGAGLRAVPGMESPAEFTTTPEDAPG